MKSLFNLSINKMTKSLQKLPEDSESQNIKFNILMKHDSGKTLRGGICHCRDSNGNFRWMRCEDCMADK